MLSHLRERTRYFIFVASILIIIVATQLIVQHDLNQQNLDAKLINQAGRQRMLSQRISKLILFLQYNQGHDIRSGQYSVDSLAKLTRDWERNHNDLLRINQDVVRSKKIDSLMTVNTALLQKIAAAARSVVTVQNEETLTDAINALAGAELPFLLTMEQVVNEYQSEAEKKLATLKTIEILLAIIAVIILTAEFVYIILPMLKELKDNNRLLILTNNDLVSAEEEQKAQLDQINELKLDLEQKHQQYKDLVDAANDMIYELDNAGKFSFVNPILEKKTGYSREELIGLPYTQMIHPDDLPAVVKFYENQLSQQTEATYLEFRIKSKAKADMWVGQNVRMFFTDGNLSKISAVTRDITTLKEAELVVQQERILLRTIIDNIPVNVYAKDLMSRKILANKAEYEYMGVKEEQDILGKTDAELFPDHSAIVSRKEDELVFRGTSLLNVETVNTRKDGSVTWFLISKVPLRNAFGTIVGLVGVSMDITERRQAQLELARKERLYRLVSENSQDVISLHKVDGSFEYISSSCITLHGYTPEELVGRNGLDFIHPEDAQRINAMSAENMERMRRNEPLAPMQFRIASKNKGYIWVENLMRPLFENGELIGFQSAVRNIAANKEYEIALQDAKVKAEEATLAKSQFLSMMSHEIRTPLNGILGITNILLGEHPKEDQLENLNLLKFSGENLLSIINDILDFSKVESGKMVLENIQFNLKELVQRILKIQDDRAIRGGISLRYNLDSNIPDHLLGDPVRLGQVLNNLVGNAIKFTEKGYVGVSVQAGGMQDDKHVLHVKIRDTGIGIPPDKLKTIFEQFSQATTDTTRKYGGTGLGLSITKRILALMGSEIQLTSELGKGSEFSFTLALKASDEPITTISSTPQESTLSGHILLAEDNDVNQAVARKFLGKWGFRVTIVGNGEEAVKAVTAKAFDLVLMDLHMPKMDGYEATRKIRTINATLEMLPIIALTADVSPEIKANARAAGMNDILAKPFKPQELYSVLEKYLPVKDVSEQPADVLSKLNPYTSGDPVLEQELSSLITLNLEELKLVVRESLAQRDETMLESGLHKNKTAMKILDDGELNGLTSVVKEFFKTKQFNESPKVAAAFGNRCDILIRSLRRV